MNIKKFKTRQRFYNIDRCNAWLLRHPDYGVLHVKEAIHPRKRIVIYVAKLDDFGK